MDAISTVALKQFFSYIGSKMAPQRPVVDQSVLEQFFANINHKVELAETQQRLIDKQQATKFNVFELIEPDENKLSDILADLLDPKGSHGQGDLFLRLLFKQLGTVSYTHLTLPTNREV